MSNNQTSGEEDDEDQIKAAVRDAARKTQERLAAYQEKQAAKAAAATVETETKRPPSKGALQAESTVSRLQALVNESKRLTNKSKELFAATAAAAPTSEEKDFSNIISTINSHKSIEKHNDSNTEKGNKLSELFQSQCHNDRGSSQSQTASLDTSLPGSSSHSTRSSASRSSNTAKGRKLSALFQSLGSSQQSLDLNGSASSFTSMPFLDSSGKRMSKKNTGPQLGDNKASKEEGDRPNQHTTNHNITSSLDGSGSNRSTCSRPGVDRGDSVQALFGPIMESGLIRFGNAAQKQQQKQVADQATKEQQEQERIILSLSVPDIDIDEDDDDDNDGIPEDDDDDNDDTGDFSIFNMVEEKKKKAATYNQKNGMNLPPEDIEELMEDYYSNSGDIFETPKMPNKPKVHVGSSTKKKTASGKSWNDGKNTSNKENDTNGNDEDDEVEGIPIEDLPPLEDILETPQISIKAKAITSYDNYDDEMDSSMPMLAPFETPKGAKPKVSPKVFKDIKKDTTRSGRWSKKMVAINKNLSSETKTTKNIESEESEKSETTTSPGVKNGKVEISDPSDITESKAVDTEATKNESSEATPASQEQYVEDGSMNLSQVFQQSLVLQDQAKVRPAENTTNSNKGKTTLRRPSLENMQEESENDDEIDDGSNKSASSRTKGAARKGREREQGDKDGGSAKSSRSRSTSRKSTHRREKSVRGKRSSGVNKEESGDSPENETKQIMDVSDLSADSSSGGGVGDGSDEKSFDRSLSRESSMRRGRSMGENSNRQQRSRSARRSVSRSASMRRRRQTGKQEAGENQKASDRRPSMSKRSGSSDDGSTKDVNMRDSSVRRSRLRDSSVRDNNSSTRDTSTRRRRSISSRRGTAKRAQRRGGGDKDASTADDILDSLDVSDIKLVGEDEEDSNNNGSKAGLMEDHSAESRSSIYDRKPKRQSLQPNKSLAGLAKLDPKDQGGSRPLEDACGESVAESIESSVSKTSRMSKFAKKVGRRLTLKGSKKKKDANEDAADLSNNESENLDVDMDNELAALAAEFDIEEKEIERTSSLVSPEDHANEVLTDLVDPKSKKKRGMLGKIKKVGSKMTKKKKKKKDKKNKKNKESEVLESDSESEGDEVLGSEYSGGTLDRSLESDDPDEDIDARVEKFAQLQIEGDRASIAMCGSESDDMQNSSSRIRQRRASSVRLRADRQRNLSLQAVLARPERSQANDDSSVQCSVATTESKIRSRRSKSTRGRIQRIRDTESGKNERGAPKHDVKRAKSLKGRIGGETNDNKMDKSSRRVRRTRSVENPHQKNIQENEAPAFNWETYTVDKDSDQTKKNKGRKKSTKAAEPKLTGGLSKLIYHHQAVAG